MNKTAKGTKKKSAKETYIRNGCQIRYGWNRNQWNGL
jgi:hypothetical protein